MNIIKLSLNTKQMWYRYNLKDAFKQVRILDLIDFLYNRDFMVGSVNSSAILQHVHT